MAAKSEDVAASADELVSVCEHVDRLLSASSAEEAVELGAELVLAVTGARGVQVLAVEKGKPREVWAAGQLAGDEDARLAIATAAAESREAVLEEGLVALPASAPGARLALVAEGGRATAPGLVSLLGSLVDRGIDAAVSRKGSEEQRALRVGLGRYLCPSLVVAVSRPDHEELTAPAVRPVSILAMTVEGLATQVDLIGPERFLDVLNRYYAAITDSVYEREGVLVEIGVERVVAVFGAPIRADDITQADLAADAGLRLLEALGEIVERFGVEGLPVHLQARVGVATGPALVGSFGKAERPVFGALGAEVSLARELAAQGDHGEMVVDSATRSLLADRLATHSIGAVEVQGLDYPVFAYLAERHE